jgi:hypothetical protein
MNSDDEFFEEDDLDQFSTTKDPFSDREGDFADENEIRYEVEYNVKDRLGGVIEDELIKTRDMKDPVQRFVAFVQVVTRLMNEQNIITISRKDLNFLVEKALEVPAARFKNPTAFVLGYWLTRDSDYTELNRSKFLKIVPNLKDLDYPIRPYDAIRYANLWMDIGC